MKSKYHLYNRSNDKFLRIITDTDTNVLGVRWEDNVDYPRNLGEILQAFDFVGANKQARQLMDESIANGDIIVFEDKNGSPNVYRDMEYSEWLFEIGLNDD